MTPEDRILDHYEHPYHRYEGPNDSLIGYAINKGCGDFIQYWINISPNIIEISWNGSGCCFSQAAASMVAKYLEGKTLEEAKAFTQDDILNLFQAPIEMERIECILVSFNALQNTLNQ